MPVEDRVYESAVKGRADFRNAFIRERDRAIKAEVALAEVHAVLNREIDGAKETLALELTPAARQSADGWLNAAKGIKIAISKVWPHPSSLIPDFTKENQYEFECGVCHGHFLGHKGRCVCDSCKAKNYACVPRSRYSVRDTRPGTGTVYKWEVMDILRGVVDRTNTKEHAQRVASDMQDRWQRDLSAAANLSEEQ